MGVCDLIYNKETGTILTRTPESWGKIGLFYFIYYSGLAAFFAGLLAVFLFAFTDDNAPLLVGSHSILPPNPGMGFRPRPDVEKTLIKFTKSDNSTYKDYIKDMNEFLNPAKKTDTYMRGQTDAHYKDCAVDPPPSNVTYLSDTCKFRVDEYANVMRECVDANYGFEEGTPCFAIKFNKIFEFVPKLTEDSAVDYLQVKCEGEHLADKDNVGPLEYYPKAGVDLYYWPFMGQKRYISPLIFVKMTKPQTGVLIQVVCKPVNAANIKQDKMYNGDGRVTFEVLIDE